MLNDSVTNLRANSGKSLSDYLNRSTDLDQKYMFQQSPAKDNNFLYKQRYIASTRSVPHRNRRLARYRISRSLNFDTSLHSSSSENSSIDGDKHLSRSAKIMRALNLTSSPTYYGKTKTKRVLNFNTTPSPKRFSQVSKTSRRALSLTSSVSPSFRKVSNYDESLIHSTSSSFVTTSPESMDENQNETPSQRQYKAHHSSLSYSTPNAKSRIKSPVSTSFSPLLRSDLKKRIDGMIYVGTPNPHLVQSSKGRLKYREDVIASTPRNLLLDFQEDSNRRPSTPENVISIIPESMSAIKKSHKKERSGRSEQSPVDSAHVSKSTRELFLGNTEESVHNMSNDFTPRMQRTNRNFVHSICSEREHSGKKKNWKDSASYNWDGNASDSGSLFDYTEEFKNIPAESDELLQQDEHSDDTGKLEELSGDFEHEREDEKNLDNEVEGTAALEEETVSKEENKSKEEKLERTPDEIETANNERPKTPVMNIVASSSNGAATPENRLTYLHPVLRDSIKKSHKKLKDDRRKRLFSPKVLHQKLSLEIMNTGSSHYATPDKNNDETTEDPIVITPNNNFASPAAVRACTPEKLNSSRLLLAQFSSVKKSHRKDKHNKMLSGFKKRQEYFVKDMESVKTKTLDLDQSGDINVLNITPDSDTDLNPKEISLEKNDVSNAFKELSDESPSKRKNLADFNSSSDAPTSQHDSELQELDSPKEEFRIFTPLKRRRSLITNNPYFCVYQLPSGKDEVLEETSAILSRCLTPVSSCPIGYPKTANDLHINGLEAESDVKNIANVPIPKIVLEPASPELASGRLTPENVSTTEIYPNLDSIKKSHKKNKRANRLRRSLISSMKQTSDESKEGDSSKSESANDSFDDLYSNNEIASISNDSVQLEANIETDPDDAERPSTSGENGGDLASIAKTPPNSLRTRNLIRLMQSASIKRSHKKDRDRRKHKMTPESQELSDDGSIFGDEEKVAVTEIGKDSTNDDGTSLA